MTLMVLGITMVLLLSSFTVMRIEKKLGNIENQNERMIEILENIRDK